MTRRSMLPRLPLGRHLAATALVLLAACKSNPESISNVSRLNAPEQVALAAAEKNTGDLDTALDRLIALRELQGLTPELRNQIETDLETTADALMETYRGSDYNSRDYVKLYDLDLSPRLKARAGVLAALYMLEEGNPRRSSKMIRKVEKKLPSHSERALAGEVIGRAGLELIERGGRYFLIFRNESRGMESLEFLVLTYPFDARCAQAYHVLSNLYEERRDLNLAIERAEDLLIFHPGSDYAVEAQLRLPLLRLKRLRRDDQDRDELVLAHQEVRAWLDRYPGHELTDEALVTERRITKRLARSDLSLAKYYRRIGNDAGTRLHAERALEYATAAEADKQIGEAQELLEGLPPARTTALQPTPTGGGA